MIPSRPLLILSVPSVAFILGFFWLRRRNKDNGKDVDKKQIDSQREIEHERIEPRKMKQTSSVNIIPNGKVDTNGGLNLGKSAPIKIQNGRSSPVLYSDNPIDTDILKVKIQDAENKILGSIDEDFESLSSPVDLPGSVSRKPRSFGPKSISVAAEEPIIIRGSANAKISPDSFLENKYTNETETNNNFKKSINNHDHQIQREIKDQESSVTDERKTDASSPSLSMCSVHSADSGKGSSLPRSEATLSSNVSYEFFLPTSLIGLLYGRKSAYMSYIKSKTSAKITLKKHPVSEKIQVCVIEGTENDINIALKLIRNKFPSKVFPNLTMQRIHFAAPQSIVPLTCEHSLSLKLNLIEGINNDVIVSSVISGGHIFLQQPLHPSHPSLEILQRCLYQNYNNCDTPKLPEVAENAICVANVDGNWYRVQVVQKDVENEDLCLIKFLDYGGYKLIKSSELRQIRSDYMAMPFQATECILSDIEPTEQFWTPEAAEVLSNLTKGIVLQAQVAGYTNDHIPEILLYATIGRNNIIFINKELVARNLAKWIERVD